MSALLEGNEENEEKKVRFDESIQLHETFPNHHHTTLFDNKEMRRKERTGIFWDADLQAEFDSWRNSPKMSERRRILQQITDPGRLYKGQSKTLRNIKRQQKAAANNSWSSTSTLSLIHI